MNSNQWLFFAIVFLCLAIIAMYLIYFWHKSSKLLPKVEQHLDSNYTLAVANGENLDNKNKLTLINSSSQSLQILKKQFQQAEKSFLLGELNQEEFDSLKNELQQRLIEEASDHLNINDPLDKQTNNLDNSNKSNNILITDNWFDKISRALIWQKNSFFYSCLVLIIAISLGVYLKIGDWRGISDQKNTTLAANSSGEMSEEQIRQMVLRLEKKLNDNPENIDGWAMLARSYKVLKDYPKAIIAYEKCAPSFSDNPNFLVDFAQTIALNNQGSYLGKARELLNQSLKISPEHQQALLFAGLAAAQAGEHKVALKYWNTLLPLVKDNVEISSVLKLGISNLQQAINNK